MEIAGKNVVVFDCEIKNEIKGNVTWNDHDKMGISVACAFSFKTMDYFVFMDDNLEDLVQLLNQAEIVTGFNIIGFDIPLVNASTKTKLRKDLPVYDLLLESRLASGWRQGDRFPSGMRLDDHLLATFGPDHVKTEDGAEAPIFWQQGKLGRLISYCLGDVKREAKLFRHVWTGKEVKTPSHNWRKLADPKLFINDTGGS